VDSKARQMSNVTGKYSLPHVRKIVLRHFTLYSRLPEIELSLKDGVFCLAGANGLGKSTFLIAVNYAITGIVPDPTKSFESAEQYYRENMDFTEEFFHGRISERDQDRAEVEIEFAAGNGIFAVRRGMFEPEKLRSLIVTDADSGKKRVLQVDTKPDNALHNAYKHELLRETGLSSFEQLVFLQHLVLTFDERRHLLFWSPRELEQTLYLAFGVDSGVAQRADSLRKKIDRAESHARNANWQATKVRKRIEELEEALSGKPLSDTKEHLVETHKRISRAYQLEAERVERLEKQLQDASLAIADLSSQQTTLRSEYTETFSRRIAGRNPLSQHAIVTSSLRTGRCALCESDLPQVVSVIRERASSASCPLCASPVATNGAPSREIKRLREIDKQLSALNLGLTDAVKKRQRLDAEVGDAKEKRQKCKNAVDAFMDENRKVLVQLEASPPEKLDGVIETFRRQMQQHLKEKEDRYAERDALQRELRPLQRDLRDQYASAEEVFVPLFKNLATNFLGVDIDIRLDRTGAHDIGLVMTVKGESRRQHHQLSESQRYFIDIALRMALAQLVARPDNLPCLYIDTPEGSLDIAYETKAGKMFASFAKKGCSIIMTANINTSRLLISLAEQCGSKKMVLHRMTSWAELSTVQKQEEGSFKAAFKQIESALKGRKPR